MANGFSYAELLAQSQGRKSEEEQPAAKASPGGFSYSELMQRSRGEKPKKPESEGGTFSDAFRRGMHGTLAGFAETAGLFGVESAENYAARRREKIQEIGGPDYTLEDLSQMRGADKAAGFAMYALERGTETIPFMLSLLAGGGVGGAVARGAGLAARGINAARLGGAYGSAFAGQTGETAETLRQAEGEEPDAGNVFPTAAVNAALDVYGPVQIAKRFGFGKEMRDAILDAGKRTGIWKEAGKDMLKVGAIESATEATQNVMNLATERIVNNKEVFGELSDEERAQFKEALVAGFTVGGLFGGAGSVASRFSPTALAQEYVENEIRRKDEQTRQEIERLEEEVRRIDENLLEEGEGRPEQQQTQARSEENPYGLTFEGGPFTRRSYPDWSVIPANQGTDLQGEGRRGVVNAEGDPIEQRRWSAPGTSAINGRDQLIVDAQGNRTVRPFDESAQEEGSVALVDIGLDPESNTAAIVQDSLQSFVKSVDPKRRVLVTRPENVDYMSGKPRESGDYKHIFGNLQVDDSGRIIIGLNLDKLLASRGRRAQMNLLSTVAHEYGHGLIRTTWLEADPRTRVALLKEYRQWLNGLQNITLREFIDRYEPVGGKQKRYRDEDLDRPFREVALDDSLYVSYLTSFDEYAAQQTARWAQQRGHMLEHATEETKHFFGKLLGRMRRLFQFFKKETRTEQNFGQWLDSLAMKASIDAKRASLGLESLSHNEFQNRLRPRARVSIADNVAESPADAQSGEPKTTASNIAAFEQEIGLSLQQVASAESHANVSLRYPSILKALTPLQVAKRWNIPQVTNYLNRLQGYVRTKMGVIEQADRIAQRMQRLSADQGQRFSKFTLDVSIESDKRAKGRKDPRLTDEEIAEMAKEHGLTEDTLDVWREMDSSFREVLDGVESGLMVEAARPFVKTDTLGFIDHWRSLANGADRVQSIIQRAPYEMDAQAKAKMAIELSQRLEEIQRSIGKLRNRNYFPRMRFGPYTLKITASKDGTRYEDDVFDAGKIIEFRTYESKQARNADLRDMKRKRPDLQYQMSKLSDASQSLVGMPKVLLERIKRDLDLDEKQLEELKDIEFAIAPGRSWLRHLQQRKGIRGYSEDIQRVYSNYMMSAANHLARVQHAPAMIEALAEFRDVVKYSQAEDVTPLKELSDYWERHYNYVMKPDNDFAKLRAFAFLWYLGGNVRSAALNLTQLPMVTYPVLGGQFGDAAATRSIVKAMADVRGNLETGTRLTDDEKAMMQRLAEELILDESMIMELAGIGDSTLLSRVAPSNSLDRAYNKVMFYGSFMFRAAEKYNRRVSALAGYRLAIEKGMSHEQAVDVARTTVQESQFEYQKWNRPEFMRGKKSVLFVFWQYMQHAAFLAFPFGGSNVERQQAMRFWMMTMLLGGLTGVPFGETILDILDVFGTKTKQMLGMSDPRVDLKGDIRELLTEFTDRPDMIMNGLGRYYGLGPLHALELVGMPIPDVDMSASLSLGHLVPWMDQAFDEAHGSETQELQLILNLAGPLGQIAHNMYRVFEQDNPRTWKDFERAMPSAIKSISRAMRYARDGELADNSGARLVEFSQENPVHRAEMFASLLGFTPTRVSQKWDLIGSQREAALYWQLKREFLFDMYDLALRDGSRESIANARKEIQRFNSRVANHSELAPLSITRENIEQSIRGRARMRVLREANMSMSQKYQLLNAEIRKLYPEAEQQ